MRLLRYIKNLFRGGAYAVMDPRDNSVVFGDKLSRLMGPESIGCGVALVSTPECDKDRLAIAIDKNIVDDVQKVTSTASGQPAGFVFDGYTNVAGLLVFLGFPWSEETARLVLFRKHTTKGVKRTYYTIEKP